MSLLIKNVRIIDYKTDMCCDLYIEKDQIKDIGNLSYKADEIIDGSDKVLMPSFVDTHVHFRDPGFLYKETLETGSRAALCGGYTSVNLMGNTNPIVDSPGVYEDIICRGKNLNLIDIHSVYAVTKGFDGHTLDHLNDLPESVRFLSDDGKGILSNYTMFHAMNKAKELGVGIMVHAEDPNLSPLDYRIAEDIITLRDIYLAEQTGARLHMSHVSTVDSIDAVRRGKIKGANVTCEVTPHHLSLWDINYRVNPPIRTKKDVKAVIRGIQDGTVDCIATDHAPHSQEDKAKGAPGMVGLETAFAVCYTNLVKTRQIELKKLSKLMSKNPGDILGIDHGAIEIGKKADLVLVDIEKEYTINKNELMSKSNNTPFDGAKVYGRVEMTIYKGEVKYRR